MDNVNTTVFILKQFEEQAVPTPKGYSFAAMMHVMRRQTGPSFAIDKTISVEPPHDVGTPQDFDVRVRQAL